MTSGEWRALRGVLLKRNGAKKAIIGLQRRTLDRLRRASRFSSDLVGKIEEKIYIYIYQPLPFPGNANIEWQPHSVEVVHSPGIHILKRNTERRLFPIWMFAGVKPPAADCTWEGTLNDSVPLLEFLCIEYFILR